MLTFGFLFAIGSLSAWAHDSGQPPCWTLLQGGLSSEAPGRLADSQRHMAMAAELVKLKGPEAQTVHRADPRLEIHRLSAANLARLLGELESRWPLNGSRSPDLERIRSMAAELQFRALKIMRVYPEGNVLPEEDFYSALTGGATTVGFEWTATRVATPLQNLNGHVSLDSLAVHEEFADEFAFVLPQFHDSHSLISLFHKWDRRPFEDLRILNRWNLPVSLWEKFAFLEFLKTYEAAGIFPDHTAYHRLGPLRQALHRFLLTPADARAFFKAAFVHTTFHLVAGGRRPMASIEEDWKRMGGPGDLLLGTLADLGWKGAAVRVPRNVPASRVSIIRVAETRIFALPDHSRSAQPRRLDYSKMPDGTPLHLR